MNRQREQMSEHNAVASVTLHCEGRSQTFIAQRVGINQSTVSRILRRYRETGGYSRRPGRGKATTADQDRFLRLQELRTRFVTSTILQTRFLERYNTRISQDTVRRRLRETELRPYVPATGPLLTPVHRRARLEFAREHVDWDIASWSRILFSDEFRSSLVSNDRRIRVYRRPGERYAPCNIVGTVQFGGGSVLVWGGISLKRVQNLSLYLDEHLMRTDM
jgi:transposase